MRLFSRFNKWGPSPKEQGMNRPTEIIEALKTGTLHGPIPTETTYKLLEYALFLEIRRLKWGVSERQDAVNILRQVCETHGDNDWPNDLHLGDAIEKHLWRHLGDLEPAEPVGMTEREYKDECIDLKVEVTDGGDLFSIADDRCYGSDDLHRILRMMDYKKRSREAKQAGSQEPDNGNIWTAPIDITKYKHPQTTAEFLGLDGTQGEKG